MLPEVAIAQTISGPIRWGDPGIQWTPGASTQSYPVKGCPGYQDNNVTITFSRDYDRWNEGDSLPKIALTAIGVGTGVAPNNWQNLLFTAMGNPAGAGNPDNPGFGRRVRETIVDIEFTNAAVLGSLLIADVDAAISGDSNTRWVDRVEISGNGGTFIPGTTPGTGITAGSAVTVAGNVVIGTGDSPNDFTDTQGNPTNTAVGNAIIDFGGNSLNSIQIIYSNNLATSTGEEGKLQPQGIAIGNLNFANPCIGVAKQAGTVIETSPGIFTLPYTITVRNQGNVPLQNVRVTENFASQFGLALGTAPLQPGQYRIASGPTTAAPLTANPGFDGSTNIELLNAAASSLAVGQTQTITLNIEVYPAQTPTLLSNQVTALGNFVPRQGAEPITVSDRSNNGLEPPGGNPSTDDTPTPVLIRPVTPVSRIGVGKGVGLPRNVGNGIFEIPYTIRVQNYGTVPLNNVQVTEDFAAQFGLTYVPSNPGPGQYSILSAPVASGSLTGNAAFTGSGANTGLLNPSGSTLAVGQSETITLRLQVNPATLPATLSNQVIASGTGPDGTTVTDDSANDANNPGNPNPDTNNDGNPNNDASTTPIQLPSTPTPRIGVGKSATRAVDATPTDITDGLFDITYAISVQNAGNVDLTNVQLTEDFASQFGLTYTPGAPGVGQYTITAPPAAAAPLAANPAFTGSGTNTGLLDPAGSTLAVGQTQTLTVGVRVNIDRAIPFLLDNQVRGTGTSGGQEVSDLSNDGTNGPTPNNPNPDPDGDGNPSNNNIPTRISLPLGQPISRIGTAKVSNPSSIVALGDGRFNIPYTIVVENAGTENLTGVQVTENFEAAAPLGFGLTYTPGIPARGQYTLVGTPNTSNPLKVNPAFTGSPSGSTNLLDAASSALPIGERREINFVVQVFPTSLPTTLNNQVQAAGTGVQSNQRVADDSSDGLNTSPDADLNPNNNTGPTSTLLPPRGIASSGDFALVKRITNATRNGQTIPGLDFSQFVDDATTSDDNALDNSGLKPVGLLNVPGLQSGDEVEYTIYYLAGGRQPVVNARLCDLVPERTTFIPNSFGGNNGILLRQGTVETAQTNAADGDNAQFFSPLAPLNGVAPPCPTATTNPNGAVFSSLGDIPNTGQNQTGFLRFRVQVD